MPLMKREYSMISKKSLPSSLDASQMPIYKGLRAVSHHPPFFGDFPHITTECQDCMRIGEWKREGDGRENKSPSRVSNPLYKGLPNEKGSKGGVVRHSKSIPILGT